MPRQSESIAALAAALAKAQIELQNPEKSLIGSIEAKGQNAPERLFRYASLASGLDIVRKTLGQHDIATVQTTAVDQAAGIVNLTTVLAHASGEWIASDWPVCPISETSTPRRMGAALTYARRYALFTLVGIAGEDDLDAPDLLAPNPLGASDRVDLSSGANGSLNGQSPAKPANPMSQRGAKPYTPDPVLNPQASAQLRDQLIADIGHLTDSERAALWAHRNLKQKNSLTADDAKCVEACFASRLATLAGVSQESAEPRVAEMQAEASVILRKDRLLGRPRSPSTIDKSVLALPELRRIRDREHVRHVANQSCLVCGRRPCDAHHLRFTQSRALGRKVSDEFTVPLCRGHHRELHRHGDEMVWWRKVAIEPIAAARALWLETHPKLAAKSAEKATMNALRHTRKPREKGVPRTTKAAKTAKLRNEANLAR